MSKQLTIKVSEEYLKLVPRPSKEEYDVLYESIYLNGQREPIRINQNGTVLDGHTRYEILTTRGITPKFTIITFEDKSEETLYVIDCNLARRHLNSYQKIKLVYGIYLIKKTGAGGDNRNKEKTGGASKIIGKTIGVNRNYVQMGAFLIENASSEMKEKLEKGSISISTAYDTLKGKTKFGVKKYKTNKVQCPCCQQIFARKELGVIQGGVN